MEMWSKKRTGRREFLRMAGLSVVAVAMPLAACEREPRNDSRSGGKASHPAFDAERSYAHLLKQVDFGPRVPGTQTHVACRKYIQAQLAASLGASSLQSFSLQDGGRIVPMWNVLAAHDTDNPRQVLLCAHWDTRPRADQETDPLRRSRPIPSANDGASGVAVLLEIASLLRESPTPSGVRFVLFDGEDYGPDDDRMYLGSRHYARNPPKPAPEWGALLDMVGDHDLDIWRERNSQDRAAKVNNRIWRAAEIAGHSDAFHDGERWTVTDDHLPLLDAGMSVVDIIDFDYPWWHTLEDTPDKCSPESLRAVGETLLQALYETVS